MGPVNDRGGEAGRDSPRLAAPSRRPASYANAAGGVNGAPSTGTQDEEGQAPAGVADFAGEVRGTLERLLSAVRWVVLAAMLLISLAWPITSRTGHPLWPFVLAFGIYNLLVELLRWRFDRLASFTWVAYADLLVAGTLYYLDAEPGGPLFLGFYVAVATASVTGGPRRSVAYAVATVGVVALVAPTLPLWNGSDIQLRALSGRLLILVLLSLVTAWIARRLVTGEARAQAARAQAARLAELDRLRGEFVAAITHELRTPLTAARAGIGMVLLHSGEQLQDPARKLLANAERNIGRLGVLIDDLLVYNQLEAGTLQLEQADLDLQDVAETAAASLQPLIQEKGQSLTLDLPEPLEVQGDARRLEQVIVNLVSNAHTHTPAGARIVVTGRRTASGVRLTVSDDGPGIPDGEMDRVFNRFYRRGVTGGSGLGLAIARAIAELHGSTLWVEASPQGGAAFHLELESDKGRARP